MKALLQKWGLPALTLFTFFFLLGSRSLNEPDEGRYSEIAREMIETGDWLVPHLWYLPHLDKPPMTYWLVAASMKLLGQNEWAARLPAALAGVSGVWAAFLLGCSLGGRRAGFWSAVILQSSLLFFVMSRMLTPDIFVTQFTAWAMYFFWRSWLAAKAESGSAGILPARSNFVDGETRRQDGGAPGKSGIILWHLAGWIAIALGFLTKGPIALAIPAVALAALLVFRRKEIQQMKILFAGLMAGFALFLILAAPWFLAVFQRMPESAHYMILGQAAGHLLGTTIKNRSGGPFYFFGILAAGLLPWTFLLGWLWRRSHWRALTGRQKDGWLLLNVWAIFTFTLFSFSHAKLPAYILPIFPALAVLIALRFFAEENTARVPPAAVRQICVASALLLPTIFPLLMRHVFHDELPQGMNWQMPLVFVVAAAVPWVVRNCRMKTVAALSAALALCGLLVTVAELPEFETNLRDNQTLKPLGVALRENYRPGDAVVCWGRFPQGLPFYSGTVISATNPPYFGGMDLAQVPFEFPGNRGRLGKLLLPDENALAEMLAGGRRVWVVSLGDKAEKIQQARAATPLHLVTRVGRWELFVNR